VDDQIDDAGRCGRRLRVHHEEAAHDRSLSAGASRVGG
jgi:hypothetical protein